jgi:Protein of unknown function (DUF3567)
VTYYASAQSLTVFQAVFLPLVGVLPFSLSPLKSASSLPCKGQRKSLMHMLYDSESFVVVQIHANAPEEAAPEPVVPELARHGFEIVDKRSGKEVYLDGSWAEMFQQRLSAWAQNAPTQEEIEDTLESYSGLANTPVLLH